jgi:cytochrome oxidase Cu insertion factor (SCO1/SenC/PrrC family)
MSMIMADRTTKRRCLLPLAVIGFLVVVSTFAATLTAQADIRIKNEDEDSIYIEITSTITQHDANEFQDISTKFETNGLGPVFS